MLVRTKLICEADCFALGFHGFCRKLPNFQPLPVSAKSMGVALREIQGFQNAVTRYKKAGLNVGSSVRTPSGGIDFEEYSTKIMAADPITLASEFSNRQIEYPCLYVVAGSAFTVTVVRRHLLALCFLYLLNIHILVQKAYIKLKKKNPFCYENSSPMHQQKH